MFIDPKILADDVPDDAGVLAMKAALRELKMTMRKSGKPVDYPMRNEALAILNDARTAIDRINQPNS